MDSVQAQAGRLTHRQVHDWRNQEETTCSLEPDRARDCAKEQEMKKLALVGLTLALVAWCAGNVVFAATDTKSVTVTATVGNQVVFTVNNTTVNFVDTDPATASIPGDVTVMITAKARVAKDGVWTLDVKAGGDLTEAGGGVIPIGAITWTCGDGGGYAAGGTMNKTTAQAVGSFTNSGSHVGTQTYAMANSWSYATGSYSATLTYTLTTP